jgi:hypothetical protein
VVGVAVGAGNGEGEGVGAGVRTLQAVRKNNRMRVKF